MCCLPYIFGAFIVWFPWKWLFRCCLRFEMLSLFLLLGRGQKQADAFLQRCVFFCDQASRLVSSRTMMGCGWNTKRVKHSFWLLRSFGGSYSPIMPGAICVCFFFCKIFVFLNHLSHVLVQSWLPHFFADCLDNICLNRIHQLFVSSCF